MLDSPWKIATLVAALILFRVSVGSWRQSPHRTFFLELANSALVAFALVFLLIRPFLLQAFYIPSGSMEPTLQGPELHPQGDRILVNRFIYRLSGTPRRGDVVVFEAPPQALASQTHNPFESRINGTQDWIKRVIGLPGDTIQVIANVGVKVNGRLLHEPYVKSLPSSDFPDPVLGVSQTYVVPSGCVFVMGDNRNNSTDSRLWKNPQTGAPEPGLPIKNVLGRAMVVFWPLNRIGTLTR